MDPLVKQTYKEVEYTREMRPYMAYFQALEEVFDFSIANSFVDLGCNNGRLIEALYRKFPHVDVSGHDYFEWSKQYADPSIRDKVIIGDLSKPYKFEKEYDFVNCSEVGEHIPREAEDAFIKNLVDATRDILILTWSNQKTDHDGQHLNPRPKSYIIDKLEKSGMAHWKSASSKLSSSLANKLEGIGYQWWAHNIMVFKKKRFANIHSDYFIQGISTDNSSHKNHLTSGGLSSKPLQESFVNLAKTIAAQTSLNKNYSVLRASDGDYYFIRQISVGSAKPGRRALTTSYADIPIELFRSFFWQNDIISLNLEKSEHRAWKKFILLELCEKVIFRLFKKPIRPVLKERHSYLLDKCMTVFTLFGILPRIATYLYSLKRQSDYKEKALGIINNNIVPSEAIYALVSTKWIFKNYKNKIGIIAGSEKIKLIQELMKNDDYKKYIGTDEFTDYISVPQKGAADNVLALSEEIGEKIKNSKAKIFLVGAGSSKLALLPLLKHYTNATLIDVGAGIDALAGIVCQDRPYFAEWTDYKLKNYDYSKIDFMDQNNPAWNNPEYRKITL